MRPVTASAFIFLLFGLAACGSSRNKEIQRILDSPINYQSQLSPWANMDDYLTWNWVPIPANLPVDPRAKDPVVREEVETAVEKHMTVRGFVKTSDAPDLYVSHHVTTRDITQTDVKKMYDGHYLPAYRLDFSGPESASTHWEEGSLLIFAFDSRAKRMVWQGSATAEITDEAATQQRLDRLNEAITMMFTSLPGKPAWQTNR